MIDRALNAKRESKTVEFKRSFDPASAGEWCELIKDIVAMANSGGGLIVVGVEDNGDPVVTAGTSALLGTDSAVITDKVAKYTGVQFDGFAIVEANRAGKAVAVIAVLQAARPMMFEKPGTYSAGEGRQKTAFGMGTLYVRHGAKSEPATSEDLARIVDRSLHRVRKQWLSGVRKVVNAPSGSTVSILPALVTQSEDPAATAIRLTKNPSAPEYRLVNPDVTHPWRQKELLAEVNAQLPREHAINSFDILAVRHLYHVDEEPRYYYKARFATAQYSPAFRDWLIARYGEDNAFFARTREEYRGRRAGT